MDKEIALSTKEIEHVYEKYKHLDHLLSDRQWLPEGFPGDILLDLWLVIRKVAQQEIAKLQKELQGYQTLIEHHKDHHVREDELRQHNAELLAALKYLLEEYRREYSFHREPGMRCENVDAVLVAKKAIANVEAK